MSQKCDSNTKKKNKRSSSISMFTQKNRSKSTPSYLRSSNHKFGLPSPSKFQGGHLPPERIPQSPTIYVGGNDNESGSDMDTGSDSDHEVYGVKYSKCTLTNGERIPNSSRLSASKMNKKVRPESNSLAVEIQQKQENYGERVGGIGARHLVADRGYEEVGALNSVGVSELSSRQFSSTNNTIAGVPKSYSLQREHIRHLQLQPNRKTAAKQERQNMKLADGDVPSAPPLASSVDEINQVAVEISNSSGALCRESSSGSANMDQANLTTGVPLAKRISDTSLSSLPACFLKFGASGLGQWSTLIAYEACVRLCLHCWARGCKEPLIFLENECALLRNSFGLKLLLLQPEEELLRKRSIEFVGENAALKLKNTFGKIKVQVKKVKMDLDPPTGCNFSFLKSPMAKVRFRLSSAKSTISSEREAIRKVHVVPQIPENSSISHQGLAYVHAGTWYMKEMAGFLKNSVATFWNSSSSYEVVQETYSCTLRLKSVSEEDAVRMQPGSGETHVFLPDGLGDDLIIEVFNSKGLHCGHVVAQVADIAEDPGEKLRWWPMYHDPEHELVGRVQLFINYSTALDDNSHIKCGSVTETVAYDWVLEVALKAQHFCQRNLQLHGPWSWLLTEFAGFYGVSDSYTKLRYLSYVMDVATPTADCFSLVHDLLSAVIKKGNVKATLSHQENRILGEVSDKVEQAIAVVFENYKSLDESLPSGLVDVFRPATSVIAPAMTPALKLYSLLHDILSSEAQTKLCRYFQTAVRKRSRRILSETDEFVSGNNEAILMDPDKLSDAYRKMVSVCFSVRHEIFTDIEILNQHFLPSFVDLPDLSSSIYCAGLYNRLHAFLVACPPAGPSPPVAELVIATCDFQRDLAHKNINPNKSSVDAKELFHSYIIQWIQDKYFALLESSKIDKGQWSSVRTADSTTPFVDYMYNQMEEIMRDYEVIISRWPEYVHPLESAIADIERAIIEALDRQYIDVLSPLKDNMIPIKFGLKYVQRFAKGNVGAYSVPNELGILLNSMKRMLDLLRPKIELQLKLWGSCIPASGNTAPGDRLSEVTVMLRAKYRNYIQAVVEKLAENTRLHNATKLKNIIQDAEEKFVDSDVRNGMIPLKTLLTETIDYLHSIVESQVFLVICRGFWDRMGQDILRFLENGRGNRSYYKGARVALSVLDDTFASQIQQLLGNTLHEKDLETPRSIMAVRSMLCKDAGNHIDNNFFY